ncbi:MAG: hypothetical protein AAB535_01515 [Patescibacteria group bacterium]
MKFSRKQRDILAQFFCNYAITWLAGGIIGPFTTNWNSADNISIVLASLLSVGVSVVMMLYLVKENRLR